MPDMLVQNSKLMVLCLNLPDGKATAVCAHLAKGVGSLSFQVKLLQSSKQASHKTCKTEQPCSGES